jgi:hypothetical protein
MFCVTVMWWHMGAFLLAECCISSVPLLQPCTNGILFCCLCVERALTHQAHWCSVYNINAITVECCCSRRFELAQQRLKLGSCAWGSNFGDMMKSKNSLISVYAEILNSFTFLKFTFLQITHWDSVRGSSIVFVWLEGKFSLHFKIFKLFVIIMNLDVV